jgi:signal transduction histidine kinase
MADDERNWWGLCGGVGIASVGVGFIALALAHLVREHRHPLTLVLGGGLPLLAASGTVLAGVAVARSTVSKRDVLRLLGWWGFGIGTTALMGATAILYERSHGVTLVDTTYIVTNNMTVGAAGGLLIGYFYVRSRRRAEQLADERDRLATERERLEVLNRVVRHDIRNDMTVVIGWLDALESHVDDGGREALDRVQTASTHVVELTRIVRDYVDVVVGETSPELQPISLPDVVDAEVQTRREVYPEASFVVEGIPDVTVRANAMLSSVVRNVLNNAVQHNDEERPVVTVSAEQSDESVVLSLADNGPGIPDERKAAVFGKGEYGLESPGTGIGLYLAATLVTEYGGDIWVEDADPKGAVFKIRLPIARPDE